MSSEPRLFIIGLGVKIPDHITRQASATIERCDRIFTIVQEPPGRWMPPECRMKIPVTNTFNMYVEGAMRSENYQRVAETIFGALQTSKTVGYVTYGNPMAYDSVSQALAKAAQGAVIPFEIIPGISSVDTILCDLALDMAPGIQVHEASWLVAAQIKLDPSNAVILLQLGTFGSLRTHYRDENAGPLNELARYLGQIYPWNHEVVLVQSSGGPGVAKLRHVALKDLQAGDLKGILNSSMYIPPLRETRLAEEMVEVMKRI